MRKKSDLELARALTLLLLKTRTQIDYDYFWCCIHPLRRITTLSEQFVIKTEQMKVDEYLTDVFPLTVLVMLLVVPMV